MKPTLMLYAVAAFFVAVAASPVGVLQPAPASAQTGASSTAGAGSARVEK